VADALPEIRFVRPIPGFPGSSRYVLVRLGDQAGDQAGAAGAGGAGGSDDAADDEGILFELRSLDEPGVRFLVGVPEVFFADYTVELDDTAAAELGIETADDALVLVVLTTSDDGASTTANLLAPVVINARTRVAEQVILSGADWPVRAVVA
jgi:flagellar assembly factor FliW